MTTATHTSMHRDHQRWLSENAMWRCDIANWQQEQRQAVAALKHIETALKEHETSLQVHAAAIRLREQDLAAHEHALTQYEQGEAPAELIALAQAHQQESAKHTQQGDAHERIKRHHHEVMAQVALLGKSVSKAL